MLQALGRSSATPSPSGPSSPGMAAFLMHVLNGFLGILGLIVLGYGAVLILLTLYRHYQGIATKPYHAQWLPPAHHDAMPPLVGLMATMVIGMLVVGMAMTGAWVALINTMIQVGQHISTSIQHLGG